MIDSARTIAPGATPACRRRIDGAVIVWSTLFTSKEQRSAEKNGANRSPDARQQRCSMPRFRTAYPFTPTSRERIRRNNPMSTKTRTTTAVTHYAVQKKRRAEFLDEWRSHRQTVIRGEDVALEPTARGLRTGVYMGSDGGRPTRCLDALVHEIDPGVTTTIHRHSWDAQLFIVDGEGWTEVDGVRYSWKPWDAIHLPAWSWHRHGNDGDKPARFM